MSRHQSESADCSSAAREDVDRTGIERTDDAVQILGLLLGLMIGSTLVADAAADAAGS
jgi:hypothetical protein